MIKILICEDNQLVLRALSVVLEREGYDPVAVSDGNKAIEMLKTKEFDLVIVDIHLPYHSGLEVIGYLRTELKKKTPVLIVTAFSDPQVQRQAAEMKVSGYITKPFNPDDLLRQVRSTVKA
jgi:DNA-binding response OmpR family regulator